MARDMNHPHTPQMLQEMSSRVRTQKAARKHDPVDLDLTLLQPLMAREGGDARSDDLAEAGSHGNIERHLESDVEDRYEREVPADPKHAADNSDEQPAEPKPEPPERIRGEERHTES